VTSEIGALQAVICHTPGPELLAVTPTNREDFLYDDIIDLEQARREHHRFKALLSRFAEVYEVRDLLGGGLRAAGGAPFLIERVMDVARSEPLGRRLLEMPPAELVVAVHRGKACRGRRAAGAAERRELRAAAAAEPVLHARRGMVVGDGVIIGLDALQRAVDGGDPDEGALPVPSAAGEQRHHLRRQRGAAGGLHDRGRRRAHAAAGPRDDGSVGALESRRVRRHGGAAGAQQGIRDILVR
jgi:hypothetical protein